MGFIGKYWDTHCLWGSYGNTGTNIVCGVHREIQGHALFVGFIGKYWDKHIMVCGVCGLFIGKYWDTHCLWGSKGNMQLKTVITNCLWGS